LFIFSPLPAAMRFFFAAMLAYSPGLVFTFHPNLDSEQ
jgi:hypothetical protein